MTHNRPLALRFAARSDVGLRRQANQDSAYASPRLLAVADGIGGHSHGEVASSAAVAVLAGFDESLPTHSLHETDLIAALSGAVAEISESLLNMAERDPGLSGMGTTLTAMLWDGAQFAVAHVGDSRGYLLRDGSVHQLTKDHTMVQTLVDSGRISPEQAAEHPRRSVLTRALHSGGAVEPDLSLLPVLVGDRYLLCSDGLTSVAPGDAVHELLATIPEPEDLVRQLIDLANGHGGLDNITCVVADVVEAPLADRPEAGGAGGVIVGAAAEGHHVPTQTPPSPTGQETESAGIGSSTESHELG